MKPRIATVWLGGCSGCHMSLLDMDERLIDLAAKMELVYGPLVDAKEFPTNVDATLIEGAVANEDNLGMLKTVRERTGFLVALGDCAVTGNVTALRNRYPDGDTVLSAVYGGPERRAFVGEPGIVPRLLDRVVPLHEVVTVDLFLPGCPPSADLIHFVLSELIEGRRPDISRQLRFG